MQQMQQESKRKMNDLEQRTTEDRETLLGMIVGIETRLIKMADAAREDNNVQTVKLTWTVEDL